MSFSVKQMFRPRNGHSMYSEPEDVENNEETQKIIDKIKEFTSKSSHKNLLSSVDLQNVIQHSSINPNINPQAKEGVETMMKEKKGVETEIMDGVELKENSHGFSSATMGSYTRDEQNSRRVQELTRELENIRTKKRSSDDENDSAKKESSLKQAMHYKYPPQASMARGFYRHQGNGGMKRVALGISDSF